MRVLIFKTRLLAILFLSLQIFVYGQHTSKQNLKVLGNCEMCKARIEKAATDGGATAAIWDSNTKILSWNNDKSSQDVAKSIAAAGHDNEFATAPDNVYQNLPKCCLYERNTILTKQNMAADDGEFQLKDVVIFSKKEAVSLSKKETNLQFIISERELLKAACCNLSESFETNPSVDVATNNAISGSRQIKFLGLDQKYTLITNELIPTVRGLSQAFGMNLFPGRWISGIQLSKGSAGASYAYESFTGHINTELKKWSLLPKNQQENSTNSTELNLFADANGRIETNVVSLIKINENLNQSIFLHGNRTQNSMDYNGDGFQENPNGKQINVAYLIQKTSSTTGGWTSLAGIHFVEDQRFGGSLPSTIGAGFGTKNKLSRFQIFNKTGYIFPSKPYQSIGFINSFTLFNQESFFGKKTYLGKQNTFYHQAIFESIINNTNHIFLVGAGLLGDVYDEEYLGTSFKRTEIVPGIFVEYQGKGLHYSINIGQRLDFHPYYGLQWSPKFSGRYQVSPMTVLRFSAGKAFRSSNPYAENFQALASNRKVIVPDDEAAYFGLQAEKAWNIGGSIQQDFTLFSSKFKGVVDVFSTRFSNQVVQDYDRNPQELSLYNAASGNSTAIQLQLEHTLYKMFNIRWAYRYTDTSVSFSEGKNVALFTPRNRAFIAIDFESKKESKEAYWTADATLSYFGRQRLPDTSKNPVFARMPLWGDAFWKLNFQAARNFNSKIRLYGGLENLTPAIQKKSIISPENPDSPYFDAGFSYKPIVPMMLYVGFDIKL